MAYLAMIGREIERADLVYWFFAMSALGFLLGNIKYLAQVCQKGIVVGHGFARAVGYFSHRLPVTFNQFKDDVERCLPHM